MIDTIGMTDIGNGRPSNQDAYLLRQKDPHAAERGDPAAV